MLLILRYEWRLKSTEKYASDSLLGVYWESVLPTPAKGISRRSWGDLSLADPGAVTIRNQRLGILTACLGLPADLVKCQKMKYDSYSW